MALSAPFTREGREIMLRMTNHANTTADRDRARDLRNNASPYEKKLWVALRESAKAKGLRFRRQQPIHPYIVDFACMEARLLIELDGMSHDMRQAYDRERDEYLRQKGFAIARFANEDIGKNVDGVVMMILEQAANLIQTHEADDRRLAPHPNPPHKGEGTTVLVETDV